MLPVVVGETHVLQAVVETVAQHIRDLLRQRIGAVGAGEIENPPRQAGPQQPRRQPGQRLGRRVQPQENLGIRIVPDHSIHGPAKQKRDQQGKPDGYADRGVGGDQPHTKLPSDSVYAYQYVHRSAVVRVLSGRRRRPGLHSFRGYIRSGALIPIKSRDRRKTICADSTSLSRASVTAASSGLAEITRQFS